MLKEDSLLSYLHQSFPKTNYAAIYYVPKNVFFIVVASEYFVPFCHFCKARGSYFLYYKLDAFNYMMTSSRHEMLKKFDVQYIKLSILLIYFKIVIRHGGYVFKPR